MKPRIWTGRPTLAGTSVLAAALAVELIDELVDGTKDAALPLIRHDLALTYGQVGLLASAPLLLGSLLELPVGVLAGQGRTRRPAILGGGLVFIRPSWAAGWCSFSRWLPPPRPSRSQACWWRS